MASLLEHTGLLGRNHAAHLLRRTTFGPGITEIEQFAAYTPVAAVTLLLEDSLENPLPPIDPLTGSTWVDPSGQSGPARAGAGNSEQDELFGFFQSWHMDVMRQSPLTLKERITYFFHTHLPARWTEILSSEAIYYQNALFRHYAYGSFKELFKKICLDNAMLIYLDGFSNRKNSPNENFAREMFELYSIGKGPQLAEGNYTNYTEDDIKAATRVLTGWENTENFDYLDPDTNLPTGKMRSRMEGDPAVEVSTEHDSGQKVFSTFYNGQIIETGSLEGGYPTVEASYAELDEMIEMIFAKLETGKFIARKLYRFFAYHFISDEVENDIISPLAQILLSKDYNITEALKVLLKSQHFYDLDDAISGNDNYGALIKSPVELFTGLFRMFDMQFPDRETDTSSFYTDMGFIISKLVDQGLNFYEPFEVAGYPAYHQIPGYNRNWITTYALAHRYQAGDMLMKKLEEGSERTIYLDILNWVENSGHISQASSASEIAEVLIRNLIPIELTQERADYFLYQVFLADAYYAGLEDKGYALAAWVSEWDDYKSSGDATIVRSQLEILLSALIQTPEFQLY